jgi:hypothetical protein
MKVKLTRKEEQRWGLPAQVKAEKVKNVGSYFDMSGKTARAFGSTKEGYEKEDKLFPVLLGLQSSDLNFRKAVTEWYRNCTIRIDAKGLELEIDLDEHGNPIELEDYIKYQLAFNHPERATSKEECYALDGKTFWIEDPEAESQTRSKNLNAFKQAYVEFSKLSEEAEKLDWVIRALVTEYPEMGSISNLMKLSKDKKELAVEDVIKKLGTERDLSGAETFLNIVKDPDLTYKAEVSSMLETKVLKKEGNRYLNGTINLGDLDGTIAWFKDPNNQTEYAILRARLEQFGTPVHKIEKKKIK